MKPVSTSLVLILLLTLWHHETQHTVAAAVAEATVAEAVAAVTAPTVTIGAAAPAHSASASHSAREASGHGLIRKACSRALEKDFCTAALSALPAVKGAPNSLQSIAAAALTQLRANVTTIAERIENLLDNSSDSDAVAEECLADCAEDYSDAGDQIDDSLGAIGDMGYDDVLTWVSAAMVDASSCEQGFKEQGGHKHSPLTAMNDTFSKMCSSVLAVVNVLKAGA